MAGYAAVVSLQQTIDRILQSSRIELVPPSSEIIQLAYRELESLRKVMKRLDDISPNKSRKKVNALDGRIKEAVWRFEDLLESHLSDQILSHQDSDRVLLLSTDLLQNDSSSSFIETVKDVKNKYIHELDNLPEFEEDEDVNASTSRSSGLGGMMKAKMVGFSRQFERVKMILMFDGHKMSLFHTLFGMPGSGKTTLAQNLFEDPAALRWFDCRVWITVGRKYELNEIKRHILAQLDPHINESISQGGDDEEKHERCFDRCSVRDVEEKISEYLRGVKRCLIVLDNVWEPEVMDYFKTLMEENKALIRVVLTTNLDRVARCERFLNHTFTMQPLNKKGSEDLLRMKVFGEEVEDFPPQLEKAAKKIAGNCRGLPLMIVTVADLLSKANKNDDPEFWSEVAENPYSDVMMDAHNQISKVLFPVYDCFPQSSKMFYLYMAAFPPDFDIPASKLINILNAEGFLKPKKLDSIFNWNWKSHTMASTSVLIISQQKCLDFLATKTCRLNSAWCYLFNNESRKDKSLLLLNSGCVDALEHVKGQRRLCLHANFVLNFNEVYNSVKYNCASTTRSLLCFGPYHPYSMPLDVGFKLLRVLDALKVRFYTFPLEILDLVLMQYLALTYNGELPTFISKLFNLRVLIIHPHVSIKYLGVTSYVPVQIWDMQELEHIEIPGRDLPNPKHDASLIKLSTLVGVSARSCTREVLERLPNIRKLEIQIELMPKSGISNPLSWFDHFVELENLDTLKCSIVNPDIKYGIVAPVSPLCMIPSRLQKLHLSGLGYPWPYMEAIGSMPNLKALKLRCYAFQGAKWEAEPNSFLCLIYLLIEDNDLVQWKPRHGSFPKLEKLMMKRCYKLREFYWPDASNHSGRIRIVDCNPLAVNCAEQAKERRKCYLDVKATFEDEILLNRAELWW